MAAATMADIFVVRGDRERYIQVNPLNLVGLRWGNPDDLESAPIQSDVFAKHFRIPMKAFPPEAVGQYPNISCRFFLCLSEGAAKQKRSAHDGEEVAGDVGPFQAFWLSIAGDLKIVFADQGQVLERMLTSPEVPIIAKGHVHPRNVLGRLIDPDQPIALRIG